MALPPFLFWKRRRIEKGLRLLSVIDTGTMSPEDVPQIRATMAAGERIYVELEADDPEIRKRALVDTRFWWIEARRTVGHRRLFLSDIVRLQGQRVLEWMRPHTPEEEFRDPDRAFSALAVDLAALSSAIGRSGTLRFFSKTPDDAKHLLGRGLEIQSMFRSQPAYMTRESSLQEANEWRAEARQKISSIDRTLRWFDGALVFGMLVGCYFLYIFLSDNIGTLAQYLPRHLNSDPTSADEFVADFSAFSPDRCWLPLP